MNLKEKYFKEIQLLKNQRINRVVQAAKSEFYEKGIINSKIKDIAKKAEVGEASVYRYFADKKALTKMVAFDYWNEKSSLYMELRSQNIKEDDTGFNQLLSFFFIFKELYRNHKPFLKFMEDFDNFMMSQEAPENSSFEDFILQLQEEIFRMVELGHTDGSLPMHITKEMTYAFISQVMVSTVQQIAIRVGYLQSDSNLDPESVIDDLIKMFTCYATTKSI